jgi:hypothetical protein
MKIMSFVICVCFCALFVSADESASATANENATGNTNSVALMLYHFRGTNYIWSDTDSHLFGARRWKIENSEPPLSPHSAVLIAIGRAPKLVPDAESFAPREVTLKAIGDIWYYIVKLEPRAASPYAHVNAPMTPFPIVVLMDGTIAERKEQRIATLQR